MRVSRSRVLPFDAIAERSGPPTVGQVHRDGRITFGGTTYDSIKDVPAHCLGFRLDLDTYREWKRIYGAISPGPRPKRLFPRWLRDA